MNKLEGKIALITGGNSGIGLATAEQFVNEGAYVFITGRREPELDRAVKEIGRNVTGYKETCQTLVIWIASSHRSSERKAGWTLYSPMPESQATLLSARLAKTSMTRFLASM